MKIIQSVSNCLGGDNTGNKLLKTKKKGKGNPAAQLKPQLTAPF